MEHISAALGKKGTAERICSFADKMGSPFSPRCVALCMRVNASDAYKWAEISINAENQVIIHLQIESSPAFSLVH